MTTIANAFADRNAEILGRPAAQNPATLGEIWRAEWQASGLDTMTGVGKPWQDAMDDLEGAFRNVTGESVFDAASRQGVKLPGSSFEARAEAVRQLSGNLDQSKLMAIEPYLDVRGRARSKAAEIEKRGAETDERTYGLSGTAVGFLAGVARQSVDPVNLATLPFGAARGASVLRMLGTEAGLGFGTQLAQEPFIQAGRADLGLEAGLEQGLSNAFQAGIGAAGFAGLLRGAGWLLRKGFETDVTVAAAGPEAAAAAPRLDAMPAAAPETAATDLLPPVSEGFVRFYHGGDEPTIGGSRWVTADPEYARNFRISGTEKQVHYVDVPKGHPAEVAARLWDDIDEANGINNVGTYAHFEVPEDLAKQMRPFGTPKPAPWSLPVDVDPALRRTLADLQPEDFEAVARHVERDATIEAMSPVAGDEVAMLHNQAVDIAAGALETGRAATLPDALAGAVGEPFARAVRARARPVQPLSLSQFIARNGGLERTPDVDYYAFDKVFVPGGGPLARRSGRSIDGYWREVLIENGYLPKDADGYSSRDIRDELYGLLRDEQAGKKTYAIDDREAMAVKAERQADAELQQRWEDELEGAAQQIRDAHAEFGSEIDTRSLYEAAELLATREIDDPFDALERVYVRQVMNEELPPTVKTNYALKSLEEMLDAVQRSDAPEDGRGAGARAAGRTEPGQGQADGGPRPDGARAGGGGGEARQADGPDREGLTLPDDPQASARLADVRRAMAENGGDLELWIDGPDGQPVKVSARAQLDRLDADARAVDELKGCLGLKSGGRP